MSKYLYGGGGFLVRPDVSTRQFGDVDGVSPVDEPGFVRIALHLEQVAVRVEHKFVKIKLPEAWAREVTRAINSTIGQLEHLRVLYKGECLTPHAIYERDEPDGVDLAEEGDRIVQEDKEFVRLLGVPVAPRAASRPHITADGVNSCIRYTSRDGIHVRITFERLDALRIERAPEPIYEVPPGAVPERTELWASVVENSRWRRERYHYISKHDLDDRRASLRFDLQHYMFEFPQEAVEVLAEGFWVECSDNPFAPELPGMTLLEKLLPPSPTVPLLEVDGVRCEVQENPNPRESILQAARLGSQPLYRFVLHTQDRAMTWSVNLRFRGMTVVSVLQAQSETLWVNEGILTLDQACALIIPIARAFLAGKDPE